MKFKALLLLILLFAFSHAEGRVINGDGDIQLWIYESVVQPIGKKTHLSLITEQRFGGDASTLYLTYVQFNFRRMLLDCLEVAPGYRQTYFLNVAERLWRPSYDPLLIVVLKQHIARWEVAIRNQLQYRIRENEPNRWLERVRMELFSPWKLGKIGLNPFVYDEVFFLESVGFFENRLGGGLRFPIVAKLSGNMNYTWRTLHMPPGWMHQSVIRLHLFWDF